jgi:hypothetical protein
MRALLLLLHGSRANAEGQSLVPIKPVPGGFLEIVELPCSKKKCCGKIERFGTQTQIFSGGIRAIE